MSLSEAKAKLREAAQETRRQAATAAGPDAADRIANHLVATFGHLAGYAVSGYLAIGSEADVAPALARLEAAGLVGALPVVEGADRPLVFRRWSPGVPLVGGPLGTRHPSPESPAMTPDLLLVPMLAYDAEGYRIGWGGGFYDRTLEKLRAEKPTIAVGVAFAGQQVDKIPRDDHDARLDWIATEAGMSEIVPSG